MSSENESGAVQGAANSTEPALPIPAAPQPPAQPSRFDDIIFALLMLFALALPLSKAITEIAYTLATIVWVVRIVVRRERPRPQPLVMPMLAFLLLSALSSSLSLAPDLSWERMKSVGLLLVAVLVAQNVRSLRQVRILVIVLLIGAFAGTVYNGWQYAYGIGAKIEAPGPVMTALGAIPGDLIAAVNGRRTRTPGAARNAIAAAAPSAPLRLQLWRGEVPEKIQVQVEPASALRGELLGTSLRRGRPVRAKGSFASPVTYSETLMQVALLVWGLLLAATLAARRVRWVLLLLFVLLCATLGATTTRASLVSCLVGGLVVLWLCIKRPLLRVVSLLLVVALLLGASLLVQRQRNLGMVAADDAGTNYRVLMWQDGYRLARTYPWFGVGMDTIKKCWRELDIRAYKRYTLRSHFHSTPIQLAAERGLPVLLVWIALLCFYLRLLWQLRKSMLTAGWAQNGVALGIMAATIGFIASSIVHYNLGDSEVQMHFWFLMGLAIALHQIPRKPEVRAQ